MDKKNLIIVGAGGFALESLGYFDYEQQLGRYDEYVVKGVLDDSIISYEKLAKSIPIDYLGDIGSYVAGPNDVFWVVIGSQPNRRNIIDFIIRKNFDLFTFISSLSFINKTAFIGNGVFIAPFCIVNANASLGSFALLNSFSGIGHDTVVGEHAVLNPYAGINGNCQVGDNLFMGTRSTIFPGVKVGRNCVLTSHSYIKNDKDHNRFIHLKNKEVDLENRL